MSIDTEKKIAAGISVFSNAVIIVLKFAVGFMSGSISVVSEAIHSLSDCLASVLAFFSVSRSGLPADEDHPFGHGRYEDMSGFLEGLLIVFAGVYIVVEAVKKLLFSVNTEIEPALGILVMVIAIIANFIVSSYLFKISRKSNSIALLADAEHLRTDIFSSAGVLFGLVLIKITGVQVFDPIIALIVAVLILRTGIKITKTALNNLLDGSLPDDEVNTIETVITGFESKGILGYKQLKSRQIGGKKNIELVLLFPDHMTISQCHSLCDELEDKIESSLGNTEIIIHAEPKCSRTKCRRQKH